MMRTARRWLGFLGLAFGIVILLVLAGVAEESIRGQIALRRVLHRLRARHEPLALIELSLPDLSRGLDASATILAAGKELQALAEANPVASEGPTGMMGWSAPGQALVRHRDPTFPAMRAHYQNAGGGQTPVYDWSLVERELANAAPPLNKLRMALQQPDAAPAVNYGKGLDTSPPALPWKTFMWLASAGMDALRARNLNAASDNLTALANLATYQRRDFRVISQSATNIVDMCTLALVWEALQEDGWTDAQLARIQSAISRDQPLEGAVRSVEIERTRLPTEYAQIRQSQNARLVSYRLEGRNIVNEFLGESSTPPASEMVTSLRSILWRAAWSQQDEARAEEQWEDFLVAARQLRDEKSWASFNRHYPKTEIPLRGLNLWMTSFSETLGPQSGRALLQTAARMEAGRQMLLAALALKRYALQTNAAPPSLAALAPRFLPEVPTDYMDGKPLRYRALKDKNFVLYSVGADGRDDGGDPKPATDSRQRDLWTGRDAVWPSAVTPQTAK